MLPLILSSALLPLAAAAVALVAAMYSWNRRTIAGAASLVAFEAAAALWLLCSIVLVVQRNDASFSLWKEARVVGSIAMPTAWWLFTCHFSGTTNPFFLRLRRPLPWIALGLIALAWLYDLRIWTTAAGNLNDNLSGVWVVVTTSPVYWLITVYTVFLWSTSFVMLGYSLDSVSASQRRQSLFFFLGIGLLLINEAFRLVTHDQIAGFNLQLIPVSVGVLIITWTIVRFPVLETIPIARYAVFQSLTDGLIVVNDQERVVDLNPAACEILCAKQDEVIGRPILDVLSELDAQQDVSPDSELHNRTIRFGSDDYRQTFLLQASPLEDHRGVLTGHLLTLHDMTMQTRITEALIEAKETAEAATHARSEFFAGMSHEIRTPINAVMGLTALLLETDLTREQRNLVDTIHSQGDSLQSILNNILDMSRIEAGQIELESEPFDLLRCLEQAASLFAAQATMKGIELVYSISPDTPATVIGDAMRVRQILINLIGNAVKFTEQGEVVVTLDSEARRGGRRIHVQVRDTGIGIPPDRMNRLFRSFSQVDSSIARKYGGSGLGLAISKRLAEFLGGTIWAESQPGVGSTFHLTFDVVTFDRADSANGETADLLGLAGKHALVVDDNASARHALTNILVRHGMTVHTAGSPGEALAFFDRQKPSAQEPPAISFAIIDVDMPDKRGDDLAALLLERIPENPPSIILLAPPNSVLLRERFGHLRNVGILPKPVRVSQFLAMAEALAIASRADDSSPTDSIPYLADEIPLAILLVEDNPASAAITLAGLERLGYRADHVTTGEDALRVLKQKKYEVVLMDVHMPRLDGIETTRAIHRELMPDEQPYIIGLTASAASNNRTACLAAGMDEYLTKPLDVVDLAFILANLSPQHSA